MMKDFTVLENNRKNEFQSTALLALLLFVNLCAIFLLVHRGMYDQVADFRGQWTFCAYTLRGIDPLALIGTEIPAIEEIGTVPGGFNTSPWGLFIGNVFYPGYLSRTVAGIYLIVLNIIFAVIIAFSVYRKFRSAPKLFAVFSVLFIVFLQNEWSAVYSGNAGGLMALLLIFACLNCSDFPVLSGISLALAMTKPQLAVPFGLAFLLQKRFKLVATAAITDILGWLIAAILTKTNPLTLLKEFFSAGVAFDMEFMGIFSPISYWISGSTKDALFLSMIFGLAFVAAFHFLLKDKDFGAIPFCNFYPASFATVFWCYTCGYDRAVLFIPAVFCIAQLLKSEKLISKLLWFAASAFCLWERLIITAFYKMMAKILYAGEILSKKDLRLRLCNTYITAFYAIFLIVLAVIMLKTLKNNAKTNIPRT